MSKGLDGPVKVFYVKRRPGIRSGLFIGDYYDVSQLGIPGFHSTQKKWGPKNAEIRFFLILGDGQTAIYEGIIVG